MQGKCIITTLSLHPEKWWATAVLKSCYIIIWRKKLTIMFENRSNSIINVVFIHYLIWSVSSLLLKDKNKCLLWCGLQTPPAHRAVTGSVIIGYFKNSVAAKSVKHMCLLIKREIKKSYICDYIVQCTL